MPAGSMRLPMIHCIDSSINVLSAYSSACLIIHWSPLLLEILNDSFLRTGSSISMREYRIWKRIWYFRWYCLLMNDYNNSSTARCIFTTLKIILISLCYSRSISSSKLTRPVNHVPAELVWKGAGLFHSAKYASVNLLVWLQSYPIPVVRCRTRAIILA